MNEWISYDEFMNYRLIIERISYSKSDEEVAVAEVVELSDTVTPPL